MELIKLNKQNEEIIYAKPISLYRIIVNSTFNTICIVLLLVLSFQYFYYIALWLETLLFQLCILVFIITFTQIEYKKSFFHATKDRIIFYRPSSNKKSFSLDYKDILGIAVEGKNVVIYDLNKKRYSLPYTNEPKDVCTHLNKLLKKYK